MRTASNSIVNKSIQQNLFMYRQQNNTGMLQK